jgi:1-acyl-sn-glycerol-3-phosphate acyltransferase
LLPLLLRFVVGPLVRVLYRPRIEGLANIPAEGPVLLASNHRAALDTGVITFTTPRQVRFLGKAEYFTGRGLKGRFIAKSLDALGYVPVERGNAQAGLAALEAGRKVLEAGGVFAIYPEGTRSLDGRLHRGHTGVAAPRASSPAARRSPGRPRSRSSSASRWTSPATRARTRLRPFAARSPTKSCT